MPIKRSRLYRPLKEQPKTWQIVLLILTIVFALIVFGLIFLNETGI